MLTGVGQPAATLRRRMARLRAPIVWHGHILDVRASCGAASPANPFAYDAEALFATADAALYGAKAKAAARPR